MSDIPTKEQLDELERLMNADPKGPPGSENWYRHEQNVQYAFMRCARKFIAAARELHRIRESPGLTAEQRRSLLVEANFDSAYPLSSKDRMAIAALLAAHDSQAAALDKVAPNVLEDSMGRSFHKSPVELVDECNALARQFYASMGYQVPEGYRFDEAHHPQERGMWNMAAMAYEHIDGTEMDQVLMELDDS